MWKDWAAATDAHIEKDAKMVLLRVWNPTDLTKHNKLLVNLGCMVAKRDIIRRWGDKIVPKWEDWLQGLD